MGGLSNPGLQKYDNFNFSYRVKQPVKGSVNAGKDYLCRAINDPLVIKL